MKYCPYCGAELLNESVAFCSECGQSVSCGPQEPKKRQKAKPPAEQVKKEHKKKLKNTTNEPEPAPIEDGYDGYYDDVQPPDLGRVKEGLDKELIKKIVTLGAVVALIITLCIAMMYIL